MDPRDRLDLQVEGHSFAVEHENEEDVGGMLRELHYLDDKRLPPIEEIFIYASSVIQEEIDTSDFSLPEEVLKPFEFTDNYQRARVALAEGYARCVEEMITVHPIEWWVKEYGW
jgi:hypothetical protein